MRRDPTKFLQGHRHEDLTSRRPASCGEFDRPVLLAWADDRFFKLELAERLAAAFPNSRLEAVPDSRTFVPEDQPERLAS